jgi:3-hydroxybutyryl-CoA dehydratase
MIDRVEAAAASRFGERIAHGALTFSVSTGLFPPGEGIIVAFAFYGIRDLRFRRPVRIGDTIHVDCEIVGLTDRGTTGHVELAWRVANQRAECVLDAAFELLVNKRDHGND